MGEHEDMVVCENLVKIYKTTEIEVVALQGLDLTIKKGELMAIIGNSGSGKSTLLNMLGGLDRPSAGRLFVGGKDLLKFGERDMLKYKRSTVGFVWQNNARNLIPYLTSVENVEMPMIFGRRKNRRRALELLDLVGLSHRKHSRLTELSGGEQQRVAIAIALANNPDILLADEPTGNVDTKTSAHILDVFKELNRGIGQTVIIVTHDRQLAQHVDRVVNIRDGRTSSEFIRKSDYADVMSQLSGISAQTDTHEEYAVVDRFGRLAIPREYLNEIGLGSNNKLKVEVKDNRIVIEVPGDEGAQ